MYDGGSKLENGETGAATYVKSVQGAIPMRYTIPILEAVADYCRCIQIFKEGVQEEAYRLSLYQLSRAKDGDIITFGILSGCPDTLNELENYKEMNLL